MTFADTSTSRETLSDADRERLLIEREHLLDSLDDLDAEFAAGDIDRADYDALRDDYTARAARMSRALDRGTVRRRSVTTTWRDRMLWLGGAALVAAVAAIAMVAYSGARGGDDVASGEIRESTTSLLAEAAAAFGRGETDRSIELYGEVLELQPTNVEALTYRGWIRYQMGDVESAAQDFDEAVAFDGGYSDVRVFRAVAALDAEEWDAAAEEIRRFDALTPSPVASQLVTQRQVRERVAVGAALAELEDGTFDLETSGLDLDQAQLAAETLVALSRPSEALIVLDAILEIVPDSASALAWRGWTLALTAQSGAPELFADAETWLQRAVDADPANPEARVFRAFVFRRLERLDEARAELAVYDALDEQPAELDQLIDEFGLRGFLEAQG